MMTNLFSSFDPTIMGLPLNWMSALLGLLFLPTLYWVTPSRMMMFWMILFNFLYKELKILLGKDSLGSSLIFISLFSMILFNNFLGLFPYIFTSTSHLILTLSLALPLWLSTMIYGWFNNSIFMLAHLVPQGTPALLMPFMVCIETISNMVRPITLAVRLMANMMAGHLLLIILSSTGLTMLPILIIFLIIIQLFLLLLEFSVSMIQAYVFTILSSLYSSEVK